MIMATGLKLVTERIVRREMADYLADPPATGNQPDGSDPARR